MRGNQRQARRGPSPLAVAPASGTRCCQSGLWQHPPTAGRPPGVVGTSGADAPRPAPSAPGRSVDSPAARAHRRGCPQARPARTVPACAPRGPAHPAPWPARVASPSPSPPRSVPGPPALLPVSSPRRPSFRSGPGFLQHGVQVGRGASHSQRAPSPSLTFRDLQGPQGPSGARSPRACCLRSTWGHLAVGRRVGWGRGGWGRCPRRLGLGLPAPKLAGAGAHRPRRAVGGQHEGGSGCPPSKRRAVRGLAELGHGAQDLPVDAAVKGRALGGRFAREGAPHVAARVRE